MKRSLSNSNPLLTNSNADKTIGFILRYTPLRRWRGVFENYLRWSFKTLDSEGKQAQSRLKAYKSFVEDCISQSRVLDYRRNKFKKLTPILRVLDYLLAKKDVQGIRWLQTIMRISEIARPSSKFLDDELVKFVQSMDGNYHEVDNKTINGPQFDSIEETLRAERGQYPEFPFQDFQDWLNREEATWLHDQFLACRAKPRLHAAFLTKKSAAKINIRRDSPNPRFVSVPAIVLADLEMMKAYLTMKDLNKDRVEGSTPITPVFQDLAKATLQALELDSGYNFEFDPAVIKDEARLRSFLDKDFIGHRITTVAIPASAGIKARIVHKGSYPVQYSLSLLHDTTMAVLRKIAQDYADSHDRGFQAVASASATEPYMSGFDATGFTDNFPLVLEHIVLRAMAGEQVASKWSSLMRLVLSVELPSSDGSRKTYAYRMHTGQPMGLWSSWAVCTLAHHCLVRYAYYRAGVRPCQRDSNRCGLYTHDYWMVGDDIVISDPAAAHEYIRLMNTIGVPINLQKSKVLDRAHGKGLIEFVHRQAFLGTEVTGLSPKVVASAFASYASLANFIRHCRERALSLDESLLLKELVELASSPSVTKQVRRESTLTRIPSTLIETGLRIPAKLGGLGSDDQNWNLFDPELVIEAMLSQLSSIVTIYRPGSPILRDGRNNADEVLDAVRYLPDDALDVSKLALTRYERSVWEDSANQLFIREVAVALNTLIGSARDTILSASAAPEVLDLEQMREWYEPFLVSVRGIAGVPVYLAREFEKRQYGLTVTKLWRRNRVRSQESPEQWFAYVEHKVHCLQSRLDKLSRSFYEDKKTTKSETQQLYEDLFAQAFVSPVMDEP